MSPHLKTAIIEFLANEFKLQPGNVNPDTSFTTDLGLSPVELAELLQRLQDALNIILPEDRVPQINTVADLTDAVEDLS